MYTKQINMMTMITKSVMTLPVERRAESCLRPADVLPTPTLCSWRWSSLGPCIQTDWNQAS